MQRYLYLFTYNAYVMQYGIIILKPKGNYILTLLMKYTSIMQ
jgi:hypothetical protein